MTKEESLVLDFVGYNMGGPENIKEPLRGTYRDLMERGFIERIEVYQLTKIGEKACNEAWEAKKPAPVSQS